MKRCRKPRHCGRGCATETGRRPAHRWARRPSSGTRTAAACSAAAANNQNWRPASNWQSPCCPSWRSAPTSSAWWWRSCATTTAAPPPRPRSSRSCWCRRRQDVGGEGAALQSSRRGCRRRCPNRTACSARSPPWRAPTQSSRDTNSCDTLHGRCRKWLL